MPPQRPGVRSTAVEPRRESGSEACFPAKVARPLAAVRQKPSAEQTAGAISKKTPEWFHISGVPVRPLTAREAAERPTSVRLLKPKTQVQVQKEKMVGTSPSNPHYFRLSLRKEVGKGGRRRRSTACCPTARQN